MILKKKVLYSFMQSDYSVRLKIRELCNSMQLPIHQNPLDLNVWLTENGIELVDEIFRDNITSARRVYDGGNFTRSDIQGLRNLVSFRIALLSGRIASLEELRVEDSTDDDDRDSIVSLKKVLSEECNYYETTFYIIYNIIVRDMKKLS